MASTDAPSSPGAPAAPITGRRTASTSLASAPLGQDPVRQAFLILRSVFVIAPIVFGLDKFTNWLVQWDQYLAPVLSDPLPMTPHQAMYLVGVVEVVAGVVVALHARLGAFVVAAWLAGIIVNLLLIPGYYDVALRDVGLLLSAIALQRLASRYDPRPLTWPLTWPLGRR
jgi:uncharacterized membrane protein YphA (DoxX/SURF4 family)